MVVLSRVAVDRTTLRTLLEYNDDNIYYNVGKVTGNIRTSSGQRSYLVEV